MKASFFNRVFLTGALCFCLSGSIVAQDSKIIPNKITDSLYVLYGGNGQGSNVGVVVGKKGVLLIDDMLARSAEKLRKEIQSLSEYPVLSIMNTHADADHTGGNAFFEDKGAETFHQENARYYGVNATRTYKKSFYLNFGGKKIEAYPVIAHSYSDALIFIPSENILFMGDTFTNNWHPSFVNMELHIEAIDRALTISDEETIVVPGHGFIDNRDGLIAYKKKCEQWISRFKEIYREGMTAEKLSKDEELIRIKNSFVVDENERGIPEASYIRFINRTLSSDFINGIKLDEKSEAAVLGSYITESGSTDQVILFEGKLHIVKKEPYPFIRELIPLSETEFHVRGGLGEKVIFQLNEEEVTGFTYQRGETSNFSKRKN